MRGNKAIRVLVVDDSAVMREMISDYIGREPGMEVAATAGDGQIALQKLQNLEIDVVTLDVQMPRMNGLETLQAILDRQPIPVIMVSAVTQRAAGITLEALDNGALDYVTKPESRSDVDRVMQSELIHKIRTVAGCDVVRIQEIRKARQARQAMRTAPPTSPSCAASSRDEQRLNGCCLAIGISTGGPPALSRLFSRLMPPLPPIVVVQHMPEQFTGPFAARLDAMSALQVKEAATGDLLRPNHVLIARGGHHLHLRRDGQQVKAVVRDGDLVSGHKPSVDVMMRCVAELFGDRCCGAIMTGMGRDGSDGCRAIRQAGGYVMGQDEHTSDVYGMNKVAWLEGNVDRQVSLDRMADAITKQANRLGQAVLTG